MTRLMPTASTFLMKLLLDVKEVERHSTDVIRAHESNGGRSTIPSTGRLLRIADNPMLSRREAQVALCCVEGLNERPDWQKTVSERTNGQVSLCGISS